MKTLTVRNVSDTVYLRLADWARTNRRSLQEQVLHVLEQETRLHETSLLEDAAACRARLAGRKLGNVVTDIRKDRQR
jgi:hypothetical protein